MLDDGSRGNLQDDAWQWHGTAVLCVHAAQQNSVIARTHHMSLVDTDTSFQCDAVEGELYISCNWFKCRSKLVRSSNLSTLFPASSSSSSSREVLCSLTNTKVHGTARQCQPPCLVLAVCLLMAVIVHSLVFGLMGVTMT